MEHGVMIETIVRAVLPSDDEHEDLEPPSRQTPVNSLI
jgi:hypothetical protein